MCGFTDIDRDDLEIGIDSRGDGADHHSVLHVGDVARVPVAFRLDDKLPHHLAENLELDLGKFGIVRPDGRRLGEGVRRLPRRPAHFHFGRTARRDRLIRNIADRALAVGGPFGQHEGNLPPVVDVELVPFLLVDSHAAEFVDPFSGLGLGIGGLCRRSAAAGLCFFPAPSWSFSAFLASSSTFLARISFCASYVPSDQAKWGGSCFSARGEYRASQIVPERAPTPTTTENTTPRGRMASNSRRKRQLR